MAARRIERIRALETHALLLLTLAVATLLLPNSVSWAADNGPKAVAGPTLAAGQVAKPLWSELTAAQRQALSPLASEWNKLDATQKKKWLVISRKFASLEPEQQLRLQDRMREWSKLTPAQRRVARESYSRAKTMGPDQKTAEWERYQLLTEEQKKKLAEEAASKKRVANLQRPAKGKAAESPTPPKLPAAAAQPYLPAKPIN